MRGERGYLSGPMSGIADNNFPAFNEAAAALRALGFMIVNPAEISVANSDSWQDCLRADIKELCDCNFIVLMPGWEASNGAHLELHLAHRLGLDISFLTDFVPALRGRGSR